MNQTQTSKDQKLQKAQAAFRDFYTLCFWFMRPDLVLTEEDIPYIIERLRADGGRAGFERVAELLSLGSFAC